MRTLSGALALSLAALGIGEAAFAPPGAAATLVVTNRNDKVNGDTSNPNALTARPGRDGISLREAIMAANNSLGPHTITFAAALAGKSIAPTRGLPDITRNRISIVGLLNAKGRPSVTLNAGQMPPEEQILLFVAASNVTVASLRIVGLQASHKKFGIFVRAGAHFGNPGRQKIDTIDIRGNVFDNAPDLTTGSLAVSVGTEPSANEATLSNVLIRGNTFLHFRGDANGIHVAAGGTNNLIRNVTIAGNSFSDIQYPVEFVCGNGTGNRILDAHVVGNSFDNSLQPVNLNHIGTNGEPTTSGNSIARTVIERNVFRGNRGPAIAILGGMDNASANTIGNTQIVNNVIAGSTQYGGIGITGGRDGGTGNTVMDVNVINNTIVDSVGNAVGVNANLGGSGNAVMDVRVRNTIFRNNGQGEPELWGLTPNDVRYSIVAQAGFAGVNHNKNIDPRFVNQAAGNYHLRSASRAIGAGTAKLAPVTDFDCQPRNTPPSIGAYEGNGPDICPGE